MISQHELQAAARQAGFGDVTSAQLKRLRRAGLLQTPSQHHAIGRPGSQTLYPAEALPQLLGVLAIRRNRRERPFDVVVFIAWEEGLWIEHHKLRPVLAQWVRRSVVAAQLLGQGEEAEDRASRRARDLTEKRSSHRLGDHMKSQFSDDTSMEDVAFGILQTSEDLPSAPLSAELLDSVTGFDKVAADLPGVGTLADVYNAAGLAPTSRWPRLISRASQKQLAAGPRLLRALERFELHLGIEPSPPDDSDGAIKQRAMNAAGGVLLGPVIVDQFEALIQAVPD